MATLSLCQHGALWSVLAAAQRAWVTAATCNNNGASNQLQWQLMMVMSSAKTL